MYYWRFPLRNSANIYSQKGRSVLVNGKSLDPRLDLVNHSPTGFAWGYSGSGPAQLAIAILAHETNGDLDTCPFSYMEFKDDVVSCLSNSFEIDSGYIKNWIHSKIQKADLIELQRDKLEAIALFKCPDGFYEELKQTVHKFDRSELIQWIEGWMKLPWV